MRISKHILPVIVISQFCCTSLWFASNGVMNDLVRNFQLPDSALGHLTSAVQFGFILGTLLFALFTIADRISPSKVFFACGLIGAMFNLGLLWEGNGLVSMVVLRFLTGFFLAGIYPVGMKIASDYYDKGLGKSLGFLVGALVLGTAFPHLLKGFTQLLPWRTVILIISGLATLGGTLMLLLVPNGPFRKPSASFNPSAVAKVFKDSEFRSASFGYFGHMWELYAFWAFVPFLLSMYAENHSEFVINIPLWSFIIIGIGGPACVIGGYLSMQFGPKKTATSALLLSCLCCLASPLFFHFNSPILFIGTLLLWSMLVIADSPLFSTIVAQKAPAEARGTALTIVNCIGFAITIVSIQLLTHLREVMNPNYLFTLLALGPILGLIALKGKSKK